MKTLMNSGRSIQAAVSVRSALIKVVKNMFGVPHNKLTDAHTMILVVSLAVLVVAISILLAL
jgi:hypothetical protein